MVHVTLKSLCTKPVLGSIRWILIEILSGMIPIMMKMTGIVLMFADI